jgi:ComF family protein
MPKTKIKSAAKFVLDILFPAVCQKCGVEGVYLCDRCLSEIEPPFHKCFVCLKPAPYGLTHPPCSSKRNTALNGLLVAGRYEEEAIRNLIWLFKYSSAKDVGHNLAKILYDFLATHELSEYFLQFTVTAVPLHKTRLKLRGYNQSELLARTVAEKLGSNFLSLLTKTRFTIPQIKLSRTERLENLQNVFALKLESQIVPEKILLIDDVATTGTTLNECAHVLKQAGAAEVWGLVIAKN